MNKLDLIEKIANSSLFDLITEDVHTCEKYGCLADPEYRGEQVHCITCGAPMRINWDEWQAEMDQWPSLFNGEDNPLTV